MSGLIKKEEMSNTLVLKNENVEISEIINEEEYYTLFKKYENKDIIKNIIDIKILEYISKYINDNSLTFLRNFRSEQHIFTDINSLNDVLQIKFKDYTLFDHNVLYDLDEQYRSSANYFFVLVDVKNLKEEIFEYYNLN